MPEMTGARFIAETLTGHGITHVFFVESTLRKTLIELEDLGVRRIGARSEKAAAYMADGYARVRRGPGMCMSQSVGAANLAAGLQDPFLGQSPVIALTGRKPPVMRHRHAYQEIEHGPLFSAVTKYNVAVESVEQLPFQLRQAFREATSGAPGPVHVDIGGGWGGQAIESAVANLTVPPGDTFGSCPAVRVAPDPGALLAAADALLAAVRPVIVAGGGAAVSGAGPELVALAELLDIPVATSLNGKGLIGEDHPLTVGVVGSYSRSCANKLVAGADLVLFVGSRTGEQVTNEWTVPSLATPVVQIDINPAELGRSYPHTVAVAGDAKLSVGALVELLRGRLPGGRRNPEWTDHARTLVAAWRADLEPAWSSEAAPIQVERLCHAIADSLPDDAILVADTGSAGIWTGALIPLLHPGQRYLRAAGSLGWGFPASLGAKCAAPSRPVICFTGDGGFWYHLTEIETALRCDIPTVTIVNNNHSYGQCIAAVEREYGDHPGNGGDLYLISEVNFADIARSIGATGIRVEEPGELEPAIAKALALNRPVVIDVVTDVDSRAPSAWRPQSAA